MQNSPSIALVRPGRPPSLFLLSLACLLIGCLSGHGTAPPLLTMEHPRTILGRGELLTGTIQALAENGDSPAGTLIVTLHGHETLKLPVSALPQGQSQKFALGLDTMPFPSGPLDLKLTWRASTANSDLDQAQLETTEIIAFQLAKIPAESGLPNWLWMLGGPENIEFYRETGFTSVGGPILPYSSDLPFEKQLEPLRGIAEKVVAESLELSVSPNGGIWHREFGADPSDKSEWGYEGAWRNSEEFYDPFDPKVQQAQNALNDAFFEVFADFPNWKYAFVDMEIQDDLNKPSTSPHARKFLTEKLGLSGEQIDRLEPGVQYTSTEIDPPKFLAPGVVADADAKLQLTRATFQGGNGVNSALRRVKEALQKQGRADVQLITNPYRTNAVKGMYPDADILSSWTYSNPDPKYLLFSETLRAAAGPGQTPMHIITLLNYPGTLAPTDLGWTLMSPDVVKLCSWIVLSRAPKILSYFYGSQVDPVRFADETQRVPPATSEAIAELSRRVFQPLGDLIRNLQLAPRKSAILNSQVARLHGKSPALVGYNAAEILPFEAVLEMAHIPADVLFDEDIEAGALKDYDTLFLPKCDVITESMHKAILAFAERGGVVVADQYLGPDIPGVVVFDFDFTARKNVSADAITKGRTYAEWNDHVTKEENIKYKDVTGLTAEEDQKMMETYSRELVKRLGDRASRRVDVDNPTVLLSLAEAEGAHYLFVINDKRTYSDRLKAFQSQLDELVPQTANVQFLDPALGNLVAYDLLAHRRLDFEKGVPTTLPVELERLGGKLIALFPQAIAKIEVAAPKTAIQGAPIVLPIHILDEKDQPVQGLQPISVRWLDPEGKVHEDSRYLTLKNGSGEAIVHATFGHPTGNWSVEITDLSSGLQAKASIKTENTPSTAQAK